MLAIFAAEARFSRTTVEINPFAGRPPLKHEYILSIWASLFWGQKDSILISESPQWDANFHGKSWLLFNRKLTVPAAETCQKMTHLRKAINSGTTPMTCHFLWQLLAFFWREINSSCSINVSKDGTNSKSHQFLNSPMRRLFCGNSWLFLTIN